MHRSWYDHSATGDRLGKDFAIAHSDTLYRCLDNAVVHKEALFPHLHGRWRQLFDARFEVLLYDLTRTDFECDLGIRPIYHELDKRIEAHIVVAFLAYCLQVTLQARLRPLAPGLTPRSALEKLAAIQMVDVHLPTTDGRTLVLSRYTEPEPGQQLLLDRLRLRLPEQPPRGSPPTSKSKSPKRLGVPTFATAAQTGQWVASRRGSNSGSRANRSRRFSAHLVRPIKRGGSRKQHPARRVVSAEDGQRRGVGGLRGGALAAPLAIQVQGDLSGLEGIAQGGEEPAEVLALLA